MGRSRSVLLIALALLLFPFAANCAHNAGEEVNVYGGTMRPKNHVYETYSLQQETGCELHDRKYSSWGEVLGRDELFHFFSLKFLNRTSGMRVCSLTATEKRVDRWTEMISQQYMIVVEIDGIRTWSPFGVYQSSGQPPMVYTHRELLIGVNENEIVNVSLHASSPVLLEPGKSYELTFGAVFVQSPTSPLLVLETQIDRHYLDVKIRLASLLNSAVILLFLQALLATITARALRSDISKNDQEKRQRYDGFDTFESTGWRQLHSDVFRVPQYPELLCALLGAGLQLGAFTLGIVGVSAFYSGYVSPTNLIGYFILVYALSCFVGGYVAATEFMNFSRLAPSLSSSWIKCAVLTSCVVPAIACVFGVISNAISLLYGCTHVVGLRSIAWMGCFWLFLSCPLTMGGTIYSRYKSRLVDARRKTPHVNHIPRLVPRSRNVFTPMVLFLLSGILPFASIFVELYLIFSSVWLLKLYYLYSILTVSIILYIGVTISVSGIATFWGLCMENHFWKWKAFGFGCSVSLYAFAYAIYFYAWRTKMQGFLMLALYVCYTLTFVILLGVVSGSISYFGAAILVRKLYSKPSAS